MTVASSRDTNDTIETIAIGDELLNGTISDTNTTWVASRLYEFGRVLSRSQIIPDDRKAIRAALTEAGSRGSQVVVFGGLGPTSDDITASSAAEVLQCDVRVDARAFERIEAFCKMRNYVLTEEMRKQAILPAASEPIANSVGLAVGFTCRIGRSTFYFLPGVPREMKAMADEFVLPRLASGNASLWHRTWSIYGLAEAQLQALVAPMEARLPSLARFGFRVLYPEIRFTLYVTLGDREVEAWIPTAEAEIDSLLGAYAYSRDEKTLEQVVVELLRAKKQKIVFAESCTAGLAVHRLTRVPGTSEDVWGGYSVYRVEAKQTMLGVNVHSPKEAVSAQCTRDLATHALEKSGVELSAAITGYMGPPIEGDTDPAGMVYLAVAARGQGIVAESNRSLGRRERDELQWAASTYLLDLVRRYLQGQSPL